MENKNNSLYIFIGIVILVVGAIFFLSTEGESKKASTDILGDAILAPGDNPLLGDPDAPITIIEFSDYQCPFCKRNVQTVKDILAKYPKDVKYYFRDFPLQIHANAKAAAYAAEAADKQGKYYEYHDILFDKQADWEDLQDPTVKFVEYAQSLNLDTDKFKKDMASDAIRDNVETDMQVGLALGVTGTPGTYVNDEFISGAQPFSIFEEAILNNLAI
jgi:protein-disulfide isomerase